MIHTAGCGYHFLNDKLYTYCIDHGFPEVPSVPMQSISAPLVHDPGTLWECGVSTDWVGQVVAAVSGQTLGDYLAEHVRSPLGMTDSTSHFHRGATRTAAARPRSHPGRRPGSQRQSGRSAVPELSVPPDTVGSN